MPRCRFATVTCFVFTFAGNASADSEFSMLEFLPREFVRDGSVSYQEAIQKGIDAAAARGQLTDRDAFLH